MSLMDLISEYFYLMEAFETAPRINLIPAASSFPVAYVLPAVTNSGYN